MGCVLGAFLAAAWSAGAGPVQGPGCLACEVDRAAVLARYQPQQLAALRSGEVLAWRETGDEGDSVRAAIVVDARPAEVWEVLTDYESWPGFQSRLKELSVLSRVPEARLRHRVEILGWDLEYGTTRRLLPRRGRIESRLDPRQESDLRQNASRWQLLPLDDGASTLLELGLRIDLAAWLPDFVERRLVRQTLHDSMEAFREEVLRRRHEASPGCDELPSVPGPPR